MTLYVYAYDVYGARTYFTVSKVPNYVHLSGRALIDFLTEHARKKLHVPSKDVRIGKYSDEKFDRGHLPSSIYKKGHWRSYTTDD